MTDTMSTMIDAPSTAVKGANPPDTRKMHLESRKTGPFRWNPALKRPVSSNIEGPFSFLNPTRVRLLHPESANLTSSNESDFAFTWTSRNNRKGRHALALSPSADAAPISTPKPTSSPKSIFQQIWQMFTYFPVWDISWNVAFIFTLGSIVWVINSFFAYLPFVQPGLDFNGEALYGGGITAFVGATIFEVGSILLMIEAVNENRSGCFGWAVERLMDESLAHSGDLSLRADKDRCTHHHTNKRNFVGKGDAPELKKEEVESGVQNPAQEKRATSSPSIEPVDPESIGQAVSFSGKSWQWFPSWHDLTTHYCRELGFLACSAQMFGATIFWISGFTALPGIFNNMSHGLTNGIFWVPQVIGGSGFIVSGTIFMIETQKEWYLPAPRALGWHVGLWNLIGGVGFTLCPCFGFDTSSWSQYQASLSTFWGSWAFLIGSVIQWYESLDKFPVTIEALS